uniref:PPM-type phosphatase domain-containing protein n=1 Tax=Ascaris lumbricoides TaxID=6252 RepID=A0A0M3HIN3_ASCLU
RLPTFPLAPRFLTSFFLPLPLLPSPFSSPSFILIVLPPSSLSSPSFLIPLHPHSLPSSLPSSSSLRCVKAEKLFSLTRIEQGGAKLQRMSGMRPLNERASTLITRMRSFSGDAKRLSCANGGVVSLVYVGIGKHVRG